MLYLLYFLLRDGAALSKTVREALPMARPHTHFLLNKFTTVIRATIKGNVAVAAVQGALGGLAFWVLGVQGALLWARADGLPLAAAGGGRGADLAAGGDLLPGHRRISGKGVALIVFGVVVIGLVDNILRPLLVGKDTQMPDYIVLMSTVGGMALFGINGFVIGPVVAALFMAAWDLFASSNEEAEGPRASDGHRIPKSQRFARAVRISRGDSASRRIALGSAACLRDRRASTSRRGPHAQASPSLPPPPPCSPRWAPWRPTFISASSTARPRRHRCTSRSSTAPRTTTATRRWPRRSCR